tara:strand:- start:1448 stop:1615 length:168 start_codon:yes stop_codon:yes gene_type:complete
MVDKMVDTPLSEHSRKAKLIKPNTRPYLIQNIDEEKLRDIVEKAIGNYLKKKIVS